MRWRVTKTCATGGNATSASKSPPTNCRRPTGVSSCTGRGFPHIMTTLVTGATGFLGNHVARQLVAAGHPVRVLVRSSSNLAQLEGLNAERVVGDLQDLGSLDRAMKGVRRVYHVAADYRLWTRHPEEMYESNVAGSKRLFEVAAQNG